MYRSMYIKTGSRGRQAVRLQALTETCWCWQTALFMYPLKYIFSEYFLSKKHVDRHKNTIKYCDPTICIRCSCWFCCCCSSRKWCHVHHLLACISSKSPRLTARYCLTATGAKVTLIQWGDTCVPWTLWPKIHRPMWMHTRMHARGHAHTAGAAPRRATASPLHCSTLKNLPAPLWHPRRPLSLGSLLLSNLIITISPFFSTVGPFLSSHNPQESIPPVVPPIIPSGAYVLLGVDREDGGERSKKKNVPLGWLSWTVQGVSRTPLPRFSMTVTIRWTFSRNLD